MGNVLNGERSAVEEPVTPESVINISEQCIQRLTSGKYKLQISFCSCVAKLSIAF